MNAQEMATSKMQALGSPNQKPATREEHEASKLELINKLRECDIPMLATQNAF